jgi:hypothetical protein
MPAMMPLDWQFQKLYEHKSGELDKPSETRKTESRSFKLQKAD